TENSHLSARTNKTCRPRPPRSVRLAACGAHARSDGRTGPLRSRATSACNQFLERMSLQLQAVAGSPLWQLVFVLFAFVLILFEVLRGWRRGLPRQVARLGALVAAYFAAYFG